MFQPPTQVMVVGGGIGGLTLGLLLHARGVACEIYEASPAVVEAGVGINLQPHAVAELAGLGLLPRLDDMAVRTRELIYANRFGQEICRAPRGVDAGHQVPQLSIHRGRLHGVLRDAVVERLGAGALHAGHVFTAFAQDASAVTAHFVQMPEGTRTMVSGGLLIGCDGVHSAVRRQLYPGDRGLRWRGVTMWRGAAIAERFLDGRTMLVAGGITNKLVVYPIAPRRHGAQLLNWVVTHRAGDGADLAPRCEDWTQRGTLDALLPHARRLTTPHIDLVKLVTATPAFYEHPLTDREPLPRWTYGRVTLLGDAAHPTFPVGSNGASQAILDARCLADLVAASGSDPAVLAAYEAERLPRRAEVARDHRRRGPERVIDEVERRAPEGFTDINDVLSPAERDAVVRGHAQLAGLAQAPQAPVTRATGSPSP